MGLHFRIGSNKFRNNELARNRVDRMTSHKVGECKEILRDFLVVIYEERDIGGSQIRYNTGGAAPVAITFHLES